MSVSLLFKIRSEIEVSRIFLYPCLLFTLTLSHYPGCSSTACFGFNLFQFFFAASIMKLLKGIEFSCLPISLRETGTLFSLHSVFHFLGEFRVAALHRFPRQISQILFLLLGRAHQGGKFAFSFRPRLYRVTEELLAVLQNIDCGMVTFRNSFSGNSTVTPVLSHGLDLLFFLGHVHGAIGDHILVISHFVLSLFNRHVILILPKAITLLRFL